MLIMVRQERESWQSRRCVCLKQKRRALGHGVFAEGRLPSCLKSCFLYIEGRNQPSSEKSWAEIWSTGPTPSTLAYFGAVLLPAAASFW